MTNPAGTPQTRFLDRVDKGDGSGCWLWTGVVHRGGYGTAYLEGVRIGVHRLSWLLHIGPIPEGISVLHRCDVKVCVNPDHLFLGTLHDNMADRDAKDRVAHGERAGQAKLTWDQVVAIRARREQGETLQTLADAYGTTFSNISQIARGLTWTRP